MPPKRKASAQSTNKGSKGNKRPKVDGPKKKGKNIAEKNTAKAKAPLKKTSSKETPASYVGPGHYNILENLTDETWKEKLKDIFEEDYFKELQIALTKEAKANIEVLPPQELVFTAFNLTPFDKIKVVILGQDPYHDDDQAHGLAFSVKQGIKPPSSLKNVYKELTTDIPGFEPPEHGNLEKWAKEGVLLLNTTLTVQAHKPNSHSKLGWLKFTDAVIKKVSEDLQGVVFILWGGFAKKKESLIEGDQPGRHGIIPGAHPSGMSYYLFRDCKCFSQANDMLKTFGKEPIDWTL